MARTTDRGSVIEYALGSLGLFIIGLTVWAAERLQGRGPIVAFLARLVLACVTAVGWVIDRLPVPDPCRRDRDDGTKNARHSLVRRSVRACLREIHRGPLRGDLSVPTASLKQVFVSTASRDAWADAVTVTTFSRTQNRTNQPTDAVTECWCPVELNVSKLPPNPSVD